MSSEPGVVPPAAEMRAAMVGDLVEKGFSRAKAEALVDGKPWPPDPDATELLVDMREALKLAQEPIAYPILPLAARGFLTVLAGRHGSGKSWLMTLAGHTAHSGGGGIADLHCEDTPTLYVDAENGPRLMGRRFLDAGLPADGLLVANGDKLRLPGECERLRRLIEDTGAGLVVLDSLRRLTPGIRENESDDMAALVAEIAAIARDFDIAIVAIHHRSSKKGAATLRGSSAIEDQADLVWKLERVEGDPDRKRRRLEVAKFRIDEEPEPLWLRMGMGDGRFQVTEAEPYAPDGPGRPRERDQLRGDVLKKLGGIPRSGRSIARAVGKDKRTVRRVLDDLAGEGLAERRPGGWVGRNSISQGNRNSAPPQGGHA